MLHTWLYLSQIQRPEISNFNLEYDLNTRKEDKKTKKGGKKVTFDYYSIYSK